MRLLIIISVSSNSDWEWFFLNFEQEKEDQQRVCGFELLNGPKVTKAINT